MKRQGSRRDCCRRGIVEIPLFGILVRRCKGYSNVERDIGRVDDEVDVGGWQFAAYESNLILGSVLRAGELQVWLGRAVQRVRQVRLIGDKGGLSRVEELLRDRREFGEGLAFRIDRRCAPDRDYLSTGCGEGCDLLQCL